jgi:hypothetical protein
MRSPFPGMDPYLEHPSLWPDVHNRLIAAIADELGPLVAPEYYIRLERRTYILSPDDLVFIGRPDLSVLPSSSAVPEQRGALHAAVAGVVEVTLSIPDEVGESYLEVHEVVTGQVVTVMELLSPANKLYPKGREEYEQKRYEITRSRTNLVEIDLLRAGKPLPVQGRRIESDYRILISRATTRPRAHLYPFNLRDAIPVFTLPLLPGDEEPPVDLGAILHALYERARYDLSLDYTQPPVPPLHEDDLEWAQGLLVAS